MQQPVKVCPQCQEPAHLQAPTCQRCGHAYRTQFAPPLDQTQVVMPPPIQQTQMIAPQVSGLAGLPAYTSRGARLGPYLQSKVRGLLLVVGLVAIVGVGVWGFFRWLNPYPFLGEWVSADSDQAGVIMTFKRNGSVSVLSMAIPGHDDQNGQRSQESFDWHADGDRLLIAGKPPVHWSVSDDGHVLTLGGMAPLSQPSTLYRRSALRYRPDWLPR